MQTAATEGSADIAAISEWTRVSPGLQKRRDGEGRVRYRVLFRDAHGKVTSRTFDRLADAQTFQADLRLKARAGALPDIKQSKKTLADVWEHFTKTARIRPTTRDWYETRWTKHIEPRWGSVKLTAIRRDRLERWYAEEEEATSLATRRSVQQVMRRLLQVAYDREWTPRNVSAGITLPGSDPKDIRPLTEIEVNGLAKAVPDRYRALVWVLALGGLRIGEAVALQV
jgi:integrase